MPDPINLAQKALEHARNLTNLYPRGSATQGEARAAEFVQRQLNLLGVTQVQVQKFNGLRSIWLFLSMAFGMALAGHAAFWLLGGPSGRPQALIISLVLFGWSGYLLWRKFSFQTVPLIQSVPHGPSQNVLAVIPPTGAVQRKLVIIAHLDIHRAVWLFASDFLMAAYAVLAPITNYGVFVAPLLYLLSLVNGLGFLAWLCVPIALAQFLGWFTGMTADLGPYSPGANDNASAVGSALALAAQLQEHPLEQTEVWLAFTGCEESGCEGMRALLDQHGASLHKAFFLDMELVGIGDRLAYLGSEGVLRRRKISPATEKLLQAAGAASGVKLEKLGGTGGAFTEMGVVWERGEQGACLTMLTPSGRPLPEWHRLSDRPERLEEKAFQQTLKFGWNVLQQYDQNGI